MQDTFTEKCTATSARFCNTIAFGNGVIDYFCDASSVSTAQRADTTYPGQTGRSFVQTVLSGSNTRRPSAPNTTTTSASSTATTTVPPTPPSSSSAPVGAIVGGVVGGIAVIGLLGLGAWFIKRHGKKPRGPAHETQQLNPNGLPPTTPGPLPSPGAPSSATKPGHQSLMSQYSNVSPYNSPPPNQTHFSTQSHPAPYYPSSSYDQHTPSLSAGYGPDRQTSTSPQFPAQGYSPPGNQQPGPVELGGTAKRGPVHELM